MRRPPYRRRRLIKRLWFWFIAGTLACGAWFYFSHPGFDDAAINEASILKGRTFDKDIQQLITAKNTPIWLMEDHNIPIVSISFIFERAGSAYDPAQKEGLSATIAEMLLLGAGEYDRSALADLLDLNGIKIGLSTGREDFAVSLVTPTAHLDQAVTLLRDVLTQPMLNDADLQLVKVQMLETLKLKTENPATHLQQAFAKKLYGEHPFARTIDQTIAGIHNIKTSDLKQYMQNTLAQENVIIGVAGDVTPNQVTTLIDRILQALPEQNLNREIDAPTLDVATEIKHVDYASPQISGVFATTGVKRSDPDFYPLYIANYIFGGAGLSSRLSIEAREKRGLTYGVYSGLSTEEKAPLLSGSFSTSPQNLKQMLAILYEQWEEFAAKGVSADELNAAKDYMLASYHLRFDSTAGLADMLAYMQKYHLGTDFLKKRNDYVRNVTLEQVNAAAAKYFAKQPKLLTLGKYELKTEQK